LIETYPDEQVPAEVIKRKEQLDNQAKTFDEQFNPVATIFEDERVIERIDLPRDRDGNSKALKFMQQEFDFKIEMLETLYKYSKFQYECGYYNLASTALHYYRNCAPQDDPNYLNALYGKLASEILDALNRPPNSEDNDEEWIHAKDDLSKLRAYIDSEPFDTEQELLQHRAWLLHWSLFIHFNTSTGCDEIIEMFLNQQAYLNTIQIICPHLLRYVAVAVISKNEKQKNTLKDLVNIIGMERENYNDPITGFLACLYIDSDLEGAQEKLKECKAMFNGDFFLSELFEGLRENIRALLFEMLCKIHKNISFEMVANSLDMDQSEVESWIDEFIKEFGIGGEKVDIHPDRIVIEKKEANLYEKITERGLRVTARFEKQKLKKEAKEAQEQKVNAGSEVQEQKDTAESETQKQKVNAESETQKQEVNAESETQKQEGTGQEITEQKVIQ